MASRFVQLCLAVSLLFFPLLSSAADSAAKKKIVQEKYFSVFLPNGWVGGPHPNGKQWQYQSPAKDEKLTITIAVANMPYLKAERTKIIDQFLKMRLDSERKVTKGQVEITEPKKKETGNSWIARYTGVQPLKKRQFSNFTVVNSKLVANFYYEGFNMKKETFLKKQQIMLNEIGVAE